MIICPQCNAVNSDRRTACSNCNAALSSAGGMSADPYVGRQLARRFTVKRVVGSGETGMVYQALNDRNNKTVAVKIIHADVAEVHGDELLRWAKRVSQLRHAKVAAVLGANREPDGTTYIVTEFVQGDTLKTFLQREGTLPARRTADILFQLCSALAPIHRAGRPHANLKPNNVFLMMDSAGKDFVKIVDVGSPELFGVRQGSSGPIIIGEPKYFSPEQAQGEAVGLPSDQFALGIIGYQLLCGALPFFGATPGQLLEAIVESDVMPVTARAPDTPEALSGVIQRCLHKDPYQRYPDLRALATDLARIIKTVPETAPKKATFGAGVEVKTLVGNVNDILGGSVEAGFDEQQDPDATLMGVIPPEIQAYLASEGPDIPAAEEKPDPGNSSMVDIPSPMSFTGALDSDDLSSAFADAMASVDEPGPAATPQPPPPPVKTPAPEPTPAAGGGLDDALVSAMSELDDEMSFTGDLGLSPPPAPDAPQPTPLLGPPTPSVEDTGGYGTAGLRNPPRFSSTGSLITDEILNAIDEELDTNSSMPAVKPDVGGPANPLATAADFSKLAAEAADKERATSPFSITGPSPYRPGIVVLLMMLLVGTAATAWFAQREAEVEEDVERQNARVARARAIQRARALKLNTAITVRLETEPAGATVIEHGRPLGQTPYDLVFKTKRPRSVRFVAKGFADLEHRVDPGKLETPEGTGPIVVKVQLKVPATPVEGAPDAPKAAEQVDPKAKGTAAPAKDVKAPVPAPTAAPKPNPKPAKVVKPRPRRRVKPAKPKAGDIRNPFE